MKILVKLLPFVVVLLIGYHFGAGSTHPKDRVEYRTKTKTVTKTVEVPSGVLPASCLALDKILQDALVDTEEIAHYSSDFQNVVNLLGAERGVDVNKYNEALMQARQINTNVNNQGINMTISSEKLNEQIGVCQKDLKR